ncbi:MAG: hypothetical protein KF851_06950 [Pirellulaceae bacterium]|nr:hypothetical protein [Pirellulaceae bacterium]
MASEWVASELGLAKWVRGMGGMRMGTCLKWFERELSFLGADDSDLPFKMIV